MVYMTKEICKYCHGNKLRQMIRTDGTEVLAIEPDNTLGIMPEFVKAKINYCPMCGRKLSND
jgi:RNA polymerase subunit RPABC4/transcription elongation factor Spt4